MQTVKDQTNLAHAFVEALKIAPELTTKLRLVMVGEGPLRKDSIAILQAAGVQHLAWLPGERSDVADIMRGLDCFVLPSLGEGISNTILEAMACGLPVIATAVGGNVELVVEGQSGMLAPAANPNALAKAILSLALHPERSRKMGLHGRQLVEKNYSMEAMVGSYQRLYDKTLFGQDNPLAA